MVRGQRGACRRLRAGTAVLEPGGTRRATVAAADGAGVPRAPGCPRLGRRAFLGTALGGTAAAAIAAVVAPPFGLWRSFDEWDADYRTDTGGRRQFGLDRQVQVDMNTQTSIALRPDVAGALGMELITGEAAFEALAPDRNHGAGRRRQGQRQPGEVRAASHRQQRRLTCVSGEVALSHAGGELVLAPRQQVSYDREQVGAIQTIDPDETSAWRQGALVFRQTPLPAVVAEINRYRRGHVVLLDGKRGASAMSGRFEIRDMEKVLVQIERALWPDRHAAARQRRPAQLSAPRAGSWASRADLPAPCRFCAAKLVLSMQTR